MNIILKIQRVRKLENNCKLILLLIEEIKDFTSNRHQLFQTLIKKEQEIASLKRIPDSFSKIVVVRDYLKPRQDDNGITYIGIEQFLLNENILN